MRTIRRQITVFSTPDSDGKAEVLVAQSVSLFEANKLEVYWSLSRYGRHMDGHDSLAAAFKHVTDEVTRLLGLRNDDTEEVLWKFRQEKRGSEPMRIGIRLSPLANR